MAATYDAVEAVAPGTLQLVERPIPEPGTGQVRIRVEACGICHTDSLTIEGQWPGLSFPRVPGHEAAGRIEALGPRSPAGGSGSGSVSASSVGHAVTASRAAGEMRSIART